MAPLPPSQTLPIPSLDLDCSTAVLSVQTISLSPEVGPEGSLHLQHRKVLRNPEEDDESFDSSDAAQEVEAASDVMK